ncbi:hypothetical protein PENANT_c055G00878, partial [Penicillium antarcticum]
LSPATVLQEPPGAMMDSLLQGYRPKFKPHPLGWEVEALLSLSPAQQMCYYNGKLFGGYIALLMDRILADSSSSIILVAATWHNHSVALPSGVATCTACRCYLAQSPSGPAFQRDSLHGSSLLPGTITQWPCLPAWQPAQLVAATWHNHPVALPSSVTACTARRCYLAQPSSGLPLPPAIGQTPLRGAGDYYSNEKSFQEAKICP